MRIPDLVIDPARIAEFIAAGWWAEDTSNDALERLAHATLDRLPYPTAECGSVLPNIAGPERMRFQSHTRPDEDPERCAVGRPLPQTGIRIVDDEGQDRPRGPGRDPDLRPSVTIGYYNNPNANANSFSPDGWFATGDLGVLDQNGHSRRRPQEGAG